MRRLIYVFLLLAYSTLIWGQTAIRGTIPQRYVNRPAVDLVKDGKVLLPEEAHAIYINSRERFDLSNLNPDETSDIWKNYFPAEPSVEEDEKKNDNIPIDSMDVVEYDSNVISRTGNYRFNVNKTNIFGVPETFTVLISKHTHSMLMTKGLLRKIGYQVPAMKWMDNLQLRFKDEAEKKSFINYLEREAMAGDADNWIKEHYEDNTILLQDVVIMEGNPTIYNLAMGPITNEITGGRRLMNSLVVPLALSNMPESVNMLRWSVGRVEDAMVSLDLDYANEFDCSWEDARWIGKRIEKLKRGDWEEIVEYSHVPKAVQMVIAEKFISRRNNLMSLLKIDAKPIIPVDVEKLDYETSVIDGKIVKEEWEGYGTRFAYGDPDSPLSDSEMTSWVKSKALQTVIDGAISGLNSLPFLGSNPDAINAQHYRDFIDPYIQQYNENPGEPLHIPIKGWVFPTFRGNVVMTRNITTGAYLGTDNMVNLVDAIGVSLDGGMFFGTGGLPSPFNVSAKGSVTVSRVYAHLRPVTSLTKALKYPFKNIMVPMVKRQYGNQLGKVLDIDLDKLSEEERVAKLKDALAPFKKDLEVGESIIVTDSLVVGAGIKVGADVNTLMRIQLGISGKQLVVGRFHIHRRSEDVIQIYRDFGNVRSINVSFGISSLLPVLKVGMNASSGTAKTKFFSLNINPSQTDAVKQISYLRDALLNSSLRKLEKSVKPWTVEHEFKEKERKVGIFFWRWNKLNSHTDLTVTDPRGEKSNFFRAYFGQNKGEDYQEFAIESVKNFLGLFLDFDFNSTNTSNNPGMSYKGNARNKVITYEGEKTNGGIINPFMRLSRVWNGWEIERKKAKEILTEILNRYNYNFYEPSVLNDTVKIFLYNISVNVLIYDKGVNYMSTIEEAKVKRIFSKFAMRADLRVRPTNEVENESAANDFLKARKKWLEARAKGDDAEASAQAIKALSEAEERLNISGLNELLGGPKNFYVSSKIDGYRAGDENGDRAIVSNSFGEFGSREIMGPIQTVQQQSEMLEGEFFIYWLMTRLI